MQATLSAAQLILTVLEQQRIDLIDVINFVFQTVPDDPVLFGAVRKCIARALQQLSRLRRCRPNQQLSSFPAT